MGLGVDIKTLEVEGFRALIAFGDRPAIDTGLMLQAFERILEQAIEVLGAPPHEEYLFFFPDAADVKGVSGSAKADSMALAVEYGAPGADLPGVSRLFAHELVHLCGHGRQPMARDLLFFAEGFTEYYAYVLCSRAGVLSEGAVRRILSELWSRLQSLPSGLTLADAQEEFFDEPRAASLCYIGGMFRGMAIDARMRAASGGERCLDDLVRHVCRGAATADPPPQEFTYADWRAASLSGGRCSQRCRPAEGRCRGSRRCSAEAETLALPLYQLPMGSRAGPRRGKRRRRSERGPRP